MGRVSYFVAARGFGPAACVPGATGADAAGTGGADTVGAVAAAGRVIRSSVYALKPITVPASTRATTSVAASTPTRTTTVRTVTGLRARVR